MTQVRSGQRGFLTLLAKLTLKQSLASMAAVAAAMAFAVWYILSTATYRIDLVDCERPVSNDSVRDAGGASGASRDWLVAVNVRGANAEVLYSNAQIGETRLDPADLAHHLGCQWNRVISIRYAQLPDVLFGFALSIMAIAYLALALLHASTRQLLRTTDIRTAWRIPIPILVATAGLLTAQAFVTHHCSTLRAGIGTFQNALLSAPGTLMLVLIAPIAEELWFRATVLRIFEEHGFRHGGMVVTSIGFAVYHGFVSTEWQIVLYHWIAIATLGLVLSWLWLRTRNWVSCALLHYLNNLSIALLMLF